MTEEKKTKNNDKIDAMFKAGAHFGYQKSRRDASTTSFIFGTKNKVEIIDLEKTLEQLEKAEEFVTGLAKAGKQILFVGGKSEAKTSSATMPISRPSRARARLPRWPSKCSETISTASGSLPAPPSKTATPLPEKSSAPSSRVRPPISMPPPRLPPPPSQAGAPPADRRAATSSIRPPTFSTGTSSPWPPT